MFSKNSAPIFLLLFSLGFIPPEVLAEAKTSYDYPELLVTPLASERLQMEAKDEDKTAWTNQMPVLLSAAGTMFAGIVAMNDPGAKEDGTKRDTPSGERPDIYFAGLVTTIVGAGWVATSSYLALKHRPYSNGIKDISKLPFKTKREQLIRERIAEEHLMAPSGIASKIKWISFASNLSLAAFIRSEAYDDNTKILSTLAAGLTFLPFVFENKWHTVAGQHETYKKKIYGPVSGLAFFPNKQTAKLDPAVTLTLPL